MSLRPILLAGGLLAAVIIAWIIIFVTTGKPTTLTPPVATPIIPVADPTWTRYLSSVVAAGASTDNFTVYMTGMGPTRQLRLLADGSFVAATFMSFPPGTIPAGYVPFFDTNLDFFYETKNCNIQFNVASVADCALLIFADGSLIVAEKTFGLSGAFVELAPFDAYFVGKNFVGLSGDISWSATFNPGPAVTTYFKNATGPTTAAQFAAAWNSTH